MRGGWVWLLAPGHARWGFELPQQQRTCQTPMLVMPDNTPAHPYAVSMEIVSLAPNAAVTMYPWKEPKDLIPQAVQHVRDFLRAH